MSLLSANLKAFLAIIRQGTVHGAARELYLSQTGVTQRIRSIEKDLKTTLFIRSRKGMKLTQEGEALFRYCKEAEDLEGQVLGQIAGAGHQKSVSVTLIGPTSVIESRVIEQCAHLYTEWANLNLNFIVNDSIDRLTQLRTGQASMAIVSPEQVPNEMDSKILKPDKYILVGSPQWKRRKMADILKNERIIDFNENDSMTLDYLKKFNLFSLVGRSRLFINNNQAIIKLFCCGAGFGTLTQEIAKPYLESGKLILLNDNASLEDPLALAWYPRFQMPSYFKSVISAIC